jgi:dienelactone hydrolase
MRQLLMICNGRAMSRSRLTASDHVGIPDACVGGLIAQAIDAFAALAYLSKQSFVDSSRIAVLGYSMGGGSALMDVEPDFIGKLFSGSFSAAIAYYPWCKDRSRSSPRRR